MAPRAKKDEAVTSEFSKIVTDSKAGHIMVMTPSEYKDWSASQGLIMGRKPDQVTIPTPEELRILINSGWTRSMVKEKHGMSDESLNKQLELMSKKERRDKIVTLH